MNLLNKKVLFLFIVFSCLSMSAFAEYYAVCSRKILYKPCFRFTIFNFTLFKIGRDEARIRVQFVDKKYYDQKIWIGFRKDYVFYPDGFDEIAHESLKKIIRKDLDSLNDCEKQILEIAEKLPNGLVPSEFCWRDEEF